MRGRLRKATRLAGIKNFAARDYGLRQLAVTEWGPLVFVHAAVEPPQSLQSMLADASDQLTCFHAPLRFLVRKVSVQAQRRRTILTREPAQLLTAQQWARAVLQHRLRLESFRQQLQRWRTPPRLAPVPARLSSPQSVLPSPQLPAPNRRGIPRAVCA